VSCGACMQDKKHLHTWPQLTRLGPHDNGVSRVGALAQLTGLTNLSLCHLPGYNSLPAAGQAALGSILSALSNLQCLHTHYAPPGPVTQALAQLTGLTELCLTEQDQAPNPGPVILPSCVKLTFLLSVSVQHLASTQAPKLQQLDVSLIVKPSDLDALRWLCKGMLTACSNLHLNLLYIRSREDTAALMAVVSQEWQPSAEALQPLVSRHSRPRTNSSRKSRQSSVELWHAHLSRKGLSLLPEGLAELTLT
jgi:hypothetical protein